MPQSQRQQALALVELPKGGLDSPLYAEDFIGFEGLESL